MAAPFIGSIGCPRTSALEVGRSAVVGFGGCREDYLDSAIGREGGHAGRSKAGLGRPMTFSMMIAPINRKSTHIPILPLAEDEEPDDQECEDRTEHSD